MPEPISAREDVSSSGLAMGLFSGYSRGEGLLPRLAQRTGFSISCHFHSDGQALKPLKKLHC